MNTAELLDELQNKAKRSPEIRRALLDTRADDQPLAAFCRKCQELGYPIYEMDLIQAGEEFYASMRRSTNGGGENSPMLDGEDDFYELFFASLPEEKDYPDNHDSRLKYYHLVLEKKTLDDIPEYPLPSGFHFTCYQDGDMKDWIAIEKSAKEFRTTEEGVDAWGRYYLHREQELSDRMFFIETDQGEKVATATAFYDPVRGDRRDEAGWLHWVAVKREYQGLGLSRPLIAKALHRLAELGYPSLKLSSQTHTWVAVKIYMDFGFVPEEENAKESREGYRILKTLTSHPTLESFESLPFEQIWEKV